MPSNAGGDSKLKSFEQTVPAQDITYISGKTKEGKHWHNFRSRSNMKDSTAFIGQIGTRDRPHYMLNSLKITADKPEKAMDMYLRLCEEDDADLISYLRQFDRTCKKFLTSRGVDVSRDFFSPLSCNEEKGYTALKLKVPAPQCTYETPEFIDQENEEISPDEILGGGCYAVQAVVKPGSIWTLFDEKDEKDIGGWTLKALTVKFDMDDEADPHPHFNSSNDYENKSKKRSYASMMK